MILLYYTFLSIVLLANQSHSIFGGDSAEFSLVARTFSIAHPPGYPLYSILSRIVNFAVPLYSTPWRVSLISSASTILTSFILFKLLLSVKIPKLVSIFSATLYIFLFPIWQFSEIPEVFALHNLLAMTITYLIYRCPNKNIRSYLCLMAFMLGLSVSHHHIFILFIPGWVYLIRTKWQTFEKALSKRYMHMFVMLFFMLGISFYLYPIMASRTLPPLDWENAKTLEGFWRLITRSSYGVFKAYEASAGNITNQIFDSLSFFIFILHDFRIAGLIFGILGYFRLRKKNRRICIFTAMTMGLHVFFLFYTNFSLSTSFTIAMYERFLIPLYLLYIIPFASGVTYMYEIGVRLMQGRIRNTHFKKVILLGYCLFLASYLGIIIYQNYQVIKKIPQLNYFAAYAKNLLDTVPPGAIFFVGADNSYFTTAYYHFAEGYRRDIKFVFINILDKEYYRAQIRSRYPELSLPEPYDKNKDLGEFVKRNSRFGIYFDGPRDGTWKPYGLLWKYYKTEKAGQRDTEQLLRDNERLWNHVYTIPELDDELKKILHLNVVQDNYINGYFNYGKLLFAAGNVDKSIAIVKKIVGRYRGKDLKSRLILVNLLVYRNRCEEASAIVKLMDMNELYDHPGLLPSLKDYYGKCAINSPHLRKINRIIENSSDALRTSLKEF